MSTITHSGAPRVRGLLGIAPYLLDIVVPLVSYYALTAAGVRPFWALVAGGALTALTSIANTVRRRKLDNLGVLVLLELALGIVLDVTVHDPRLTLARGSLFVGLAAIWTLVNTATGRPFTVDATKPFAAKKAGADGVAAFEWLARNSPRFLRLQRALSAVWGVTFLAYAAVRVVIVYRVTVGEAVWLTEVPGVIAIAICLIASARAGKRLEALVNERMEQAAADPA